MKKTLIMRNSLLSLLLGLSISGCNDYTGSSPNVVIDTSHRGIVEGNGSNEDTNVKVEYFSTDDSVKLSAINEAGDATVPITIGGGIRISGENGGEQVQKICSFLGFTSPELGRYTIINDYTSRTEVYREKPEYTHRNYRDFSATYPVLHATLVPNSVSGSMFPDTLDIQSHYFDSEKERPKYYESYIENEIGEKKSYMASITCFGTTLSHFKDNSAINDDYPEMIKSILAAKLATIIKPASNFYTGSSFFLIKNAHDFWHLRFENFIRVRDYDDEDNFLDMAKKGAANICKESGYNNLLSYTLRYEFVDDVSSHVYEFNETSDVWELKTKPTKRTIIRKRGPNTPPDEMEAPSAFLDKIYCI